jgi:hypothetical protein
MYDSTVRRHALALIERGLSLQAISAASGINRATLRDWRDHPEKANRPRATCPRCDGIPSLPEPRADYAYLLGISRTGAREKNVWALRIICADAWPGLVADCKLARLSAYVRNGVRDSAEDRCLVEV